MNVRQEQAICAKDEEGNRFRQDFVTYMADTLYFRKVLLSESPGLAR
jgi:hypothetical protein